MKILKFLGFFSLCIVAYLAFLSVQYEGVGAPQLSTSEKATKLNNVKNDIIATRIFEQEQVFCSENLQDVVVGRITEQEYEESCVSETVEFVEYAYAVKKSVKKKDEISKDNKKLKEKRPDGKIVETFFDKDRFHFKNGDWYDVEYDVISRTEYEQVVAWGGASIAYAQSPETFNSSGTFNVPSGVTSVEVLVVGGGGSGGAGFGGAGGGAGEVIYNAAYAVTPLDAIAVTVGAGGAAVTGNNNGNVGASSTFDGIYADGGGRGAGGGNSRSGGVGGSGGGACGGTGAGSGGAADATCPSGFTCSKNAGGSDPAGTSFTPGGGGGAGAAGQAGSTVAGNGGNGIAYSISGSSVTYGGGGGGGDDVTPGTGGTGGGGTGSTGTTAGSGTANTGGGGGGIWSPNNGSQFSGAGGSGVVIVAYEAAATPTGEEYIQIF